MSRRFPRRRNAYSHAHLWLRSLIDDGERASEDDAELQEEDRLAPRAMNMHLIGVAVPNLEGFEVRAQFNEKQTLNLVSPTEIDRHNLARPRTYRR